MNKKQRSNFSNYIKLSPSQIKRKSFKSLFFGTFICLVICLISLITILDFAVTEIPRAFDGSRPEDYPHYYFSGRRVLRGESVYWGIEQDIYEELGWHYKYYPADPPATIIFLSPFSIFSYGVSWVIFAVCSILIAIGTIFFTAKKLNYSPLKSVTFTLVFLSSAPFLYLLLSNHLEMWLILFGILGLNALKKGKLFLGKVFWGLAGILKLFPLLWLFVTVHKDRKTFFQATGVTAGIIVLSFIIVGLENTLYFITEILSKSQQWQGTFANYSILSLGYSVNAPLIGWGITVLTGCLVFYPRLWKGPADDIFIKSVSLSLLISPLSWLYYQILLFPCLIILDSYIPKREKGIRGLLYILYFIVWGWPVVYLWGMDISPYYLRIPLVFLPTIATTIIIFYLSHFYIFKFSDAKPSATPTPHFNPF